MTRQKPCRTDEQLETICCSGYVRDGRGSNAGARSSSNGRLCVGGKAGGIGAFTNGDLDNELLVPFVA